MQQEAPSERVLSVRLGAEAPRIDTCSGHVLLAFATAEARADMVANIPSNHRKPGKAELMKIIDRISADGFESIPSGQIQGVQDVGFPVFDQSGGVVAALVMPYVAYLDDSNPVKIAEARESVARSARSISESLGLSAGNFCLSYFIMFAVTWMPAYLVEQHGLSQASMSSFMAVAFGGLAIVSPLGGHLADRMVGRGHQKVMVHRRFTLAGILIGALILIGAFAENTTLILTLMAISFAGIGITLPNNWALLQALVPASSVGRGVGVQNTANSMAGAIAALLSGWLLQVTGNYKGPIIAIVVFLMIGLMAYYFFARSRYSLIDSAG